jgi:TonB-dependent receptor
MNMRHGMRTARYLATTAIVLASCFEAAYATEADTAAPDRSVAGAGMPAKIVTLPETARYQPVESLSAAGQSDAQASPAQAEAPRSEPAQDIVVMGYRKSLESSANTKKNSTNFVDSIYAEDIGKFPDLNLAESLQRLPGVQIDRDASGEGTYINVRGLSAGFTVTTVNGFAVNTSSNGFNQGRGSSLDILPSELFRRVTLSKSPTASTVEGGTAGVVDLQPVRAFDRKGFQLSVQAQGAYQTADKTTTPRAALIVSNTFDTGIGEFGILIGGAYAKRNYRSEIFNTVGYTTMNLGTACPSNRAGCNTLNTATGGYGGGAGATLTTVPQNVPASLGLGAAGSPLVKCGQGVPGGTSGMSCEDLSYVIVPRLVRAEQVVGERTRSTGLLNFEYRPIDSLRFKADLLYSDSPNRFAQYDVMLTVRNYNNNIPINFKTDENRVLTSGTFGNAYFLNQSTDSDSSTSFFYRAFSMDWDATENIRFSTQAMLNTGKFRNLPLQYTLQSAPGQVNPVVYAAGQTAPASQPGSNLTPLNTGQFAVYNYTPGSITPSIQTSIDLPTYRNWYWNSILITPQRQDLDQRAFRADLYLGKPETAQLSIGFMKQTFDRRIADYNISDCAFRNACTSVFTSTQTSLVGAIPNSALPDYLTQLPSMNLFQGAPFNAGLSNGWLVPDFAKIRNAVNLDYYINDLNPGTTAANYLNTYTPRIISEDVKSGYVMADGRIQIFGNELRYNAGVRYTKGTQEVSGIVNDFILIGGTGSRSTPRFSAKTSNWLPSFNAAYFLTNNLVLRGAAARTVTRPNPADLLPTYGLSLDGDVFTLGNPALRPFYADNFDAGLEWYSRSGRVVTLNGWWKNIYDYPFVLNSTIPFSQSGIDFARINDRQRAGITNLGNGNPNNAVLLLSQRQNSDLVIHLFGQEVQWVQPLDFLMKGVGFNVNVTHISQKLSGTRPPNFNPNALLAGLAPWTYNGTVYYEHRSGFSFRVSYTHRDANLASVCPCNNIPGDLYTVATDYMDAQVTLPFPWYDRIKFTIQAQNLLKQVQYNQYANRESQPDGATYAGRNIVVGVRANF